MSCNTLPSFLEATAPLTLDYASEPHKRGEQLLRHQRPFLATPSPRDVRYGGHLLGDRERLAAHFRTEGLEPYLASKLSAMEERDLLTPAPLPHRPFSGDLRDLPFFSLEALPLSRYLTAGIVAIETEERGLNLSYHRMQYVSPDQLVMRVVRRHLHSILTQRGGSSRAMILLGVPPAIALAAAFPAELPGGELFLAEALSPGSGQCATHSQMPTPIAAEMIIFGTFTGETAPEGPFIDLTGTRDFVRDEPLFRVSEVLIRPSPVIPMILPASEEHALLMGLPREVAIFASLTGSGVAVRGVALTTGGCGWLHGVVSCQPSMNPIEIGNRALAAHPSMKRVVVVNSDIDPHDANQVEWAMATRFQPSRDMHILPASRGSTLDPSGKDGVTDKYICDATIPAGANIDDFRRLL